MPPSGHNKTTGDWPASQLVVASAPRSVRITPDMTNQASTTTAKARPDRRGRLSAKMCTPIDMSTTTDIASHTTVGIGIFQSGTNMTPAIKAPGTTRPIAGMNFATAL